MTEFKSNQDGMYAACYAHGRLSVIVKYWDDVEKSPGFLKGEIADIFRELSEGIYKQDAK